MELILIIIIIPTTYLKNWAFVILIIIVNFMIDQCFFPLEILARVNNIFFSQQHFKATCDFLSPSTHVCFFLFEQFIGQQMV